MEADEESYYQNDSPIRGRKIANNAVNNVNNLESRSGFSYSPPNK